MTSSRKPDELPPALSSMWRLCRLGLRYEPSLMIWAFSLAMLSALPDALLALWFKLMADAALAGNRTRLVLTTLARYLGCRHMVPSHREHPCPAAFSRQGHHRARSTRGAPPGED